MKVVAFDSVPPGDWNACCDASQQAWLFHRAEWIGIETANFTPANLAFALVSSDRVVGVQPLYFMEVGLGAWAERLVHSGFHRHTGLALAPDLAPHEIKAARSLAMRRITEAAEGMDADRIQLNVQNLAPESFTPDRQEVPFWVSDHGYRQGLNIGPSGVVPFPGLATCCADQIVPLSEPEEFLFAALDESCRRAVRKGAASGLQAAAVTGCTSQTVDRYYELALVSAQRTGETLAPKGYFEHLVQVLGPSQKVAVVFVTLEGETVAAILLGLEKGSASYLGGVSDSRFLHLRVNDFAHWEAIRWAKAAGLAWYRLGPIFPELPPDWPVSKVSRFKGKFGGRSFSTIQGSRFLKVEKYLAAMDDLLPQLGGVALTCGPPRV